MKLLVPVAALIALVLTVSRAEADTVELRTGGKLIGEIEAETSDEVAVRTPAGVVRVGRSDVLRIRRSESRESGAGESGAGASPKRTGPRLRIRGVKAGVPPVMTRGLLVLALERGGVTTVDILTGRKPAGFTVEHRLGSVTGLAADSGAVYVATAEGAVSRLNRLDGKPLWTAALGGRVHGAPVLHRRWAFVFLPGRGLLALERATGVIRSTLPLDIEPDSPLVRAGAGLAIGGEDGRLLLISGDGTEVLRTIETSSRWFGSPPAVTLNRVALADRGKLLLVPLGPGTAAREAPVGLMRHPLDAGPSRVFCKSMGSLAALTPLTGRTMWTATEVGEVTHLTIGGAEILAATSDGRICAVSPGSGSRLWSVALGAAVSCPPLAAEGRVAVVTERGECQILDPSNLPPDEDAIPGAEADPADTRAGRFRSPDGYSISVPAGWVKSDRLTGEKVSIALRPSGAATRKKLPAVSEADLNEYVRCGRLQIRVVPAGGESASNLALNYLIQEQERASEGGYRLAPPSITKTVLDGREWTRVELRVEQEVPGGSRTLYKQALVDLLPGDRAAWVELLAPEALRTICVEDLMELVRSFAEEE